YAASRLLHSFPTRRSSDLALFYEDSTGKVVYHGPYTALRGQEMTHAYKSVLDISTTVKAGLLIRQTHHWAANIFIAAIVLHVVRSEEHTSELQSQSNLVCR